MFLLRSLNNGNVNTKKYQFFPALYADLTISNTYITHIGQQFTPLHFSLLLTPLARILSVYDFFLFFLLFWSGVIVYKTIEIKSYNPDRRLVFFAGGRNIN